MDVLAIHPSEDIGAIAAFFALSNRMADFTAMRPNDEFYPMGRVPKEK